MSAPEPIRVVVVDDSEMLTTMLAMHLNSDERFRLVGKDENGSAALELVRQAQPRVIVIDLGLPDVDALDLVAELRAANPNLGIVVFSGQTERAAAAKALAAGGDAYVSKPVGWDGLCPVIIETAAGHQ